MTRASHVISSFLRDRQANFAILTGLLAAGVIAALGGATDVSMQYRADSSLQVAVDAGALAGAKKLEQDFAADPASLVSTMIRGNTPANLSGLSITTSVDRTARTVTVRATGKIKPNFLPLLRIDDLDIDVTAASSIQKEQHNDFYFLLDVSESMNLAASDADRDKLEAFTKNYNNRPCAFACHEVEEWAAPISVYDMNQIALKMTPSQGARLRIDVLRDAADKMIDKMLAENAVPGTLKTNRIATAGFSWDFAKGKNVTTDAAALKASIRNFSVANNHTRFWWALAKFSTMLGLQGSGDTATSPKKVAILVTDGVKDEGFGWGQLGPLDADLCSAIKAKNIDLAVLEIKYVARPQEYFFNERVASYYSSISPSLKACATPGLYFLASDADEASAGLLKLTDAVLSQRHLIH